ncbi:hypothetical protein D915_005493 [Fasciola hepatica]|uniref:Uncharacterized protein n=1 Tax=Fasciola hepatica TaxID=6192 RepID=A0A4E0RQD6_FASHE|nr:hypothetical protein D915_005493 [Fasciola hepatica]
MLRCDSDGAKQLSYHNSGKTLVHFIQFVYTEHHEKPGFASKTLNANAMTSELASFIVSVFTMDLLDFESMLKQDTQLTESEQRVIYRQAKDIQEVLSWFNVKPSEVTQTLEEFSYLMDHEPIMDKPRKKKYQLDVIFPSSYLNRAGNELLAEFTTVQFVDDEPRAPLEEIYKGQPAKKRTPRKEEKETGPSRSILKLMTQRLSEIKKAFEDPLREQESALSRLGAKLVDGWKHLTEAVTAEGKLKEEEEFEGEQEMVAFETGRIPITARTASGAAESKWQRKGGVKRPQPTESPSDRVVVAPMLGEDLAKHLSPVKHTATPKELATARPPYDNVIALHPGTKKAPSKRARDVSSSPAPFAAVANLMGPGASIKLPGIATTPIERAKRGRTQEPLLTHSPIDIRQQKMDTHVRSAILAMTGVSIKKKTKTRGAKRDISIQTLSSPTSSSRAASVEGTASVQSTGKKPEVAERREPPFRFASSTGTPLSSVGALPEIISTESLRREVSPDKVQTHTLEMVSEQVDRMSYEAQRLSELEEITPKATGVWTWLDTLLAPQTKSSALLQSPYQTSASEQKFGALRRLHRASGTRLISRFEEKGEHLQYLVRNLEDTDMLVTPSDQEPAPIQVKYMKETEDEQTKITRSKYLSGSLFTAIAPGAQRAELIRKRLVEKGMFSPLAGRTGRGETERVSRHTSKDSVGINRFATDLDFATKYLQTVIPPGRLTLLLNEIQGDETSPDALTALEEALILAANKADAAEHE